MSDTEFINWWHERTVAGTTAEQRAAWRAWLRSQPPLAYATLITDVPQELRGEFVTVYALIFG